MTENERVKAFFESYLPSFKSLDAWQINGDIAIHQIDENITITIDAFNFDPVIVEVEAGDYRATYLASADQCVDDLPNIIRGLLAGIDAFNLHV